MSNNSQIKVKPKREVERERLEQEILDEKIRRAEIQALRLYAEKYPKILKEEYQKLRTQTV